MPSPTPFDSLKAAQEEVQSAADIVTTFKRLEGRSEAKAGEAEQELLAARKMLAYSRAVLQEKLATLKELQQKAQDA